MSSFKEFVNESKSMPKFVLISNLDKAEKYLEQVRINIKEDTDITDRHAKQDLKKALQELRKIDKQL